MPDIRKLFAENSLSGKLSALAAVITAVSVIVYVIYGLVFNYFDLVVLLFLIGACACAYFHAAGKSFYLNMTAVMCLSGAIALFFLNSFPVWADELNGITMYASRGGLVPVISILILLFGSVILEIVSCFLKERKVTA